jgi:hypothetical protein
MKKLQWWAALALAAGTATAGAAGIDDPAAIPAVQKIITFDGYDGEVTTGPVDVGGEIGMTVWFSSGPTAVLGANVQDLGSNGAWLELPGTTTTVDNRFVASSFAAMRGEMGFSFAQPVSAVGAFFNNFQREGVKNSMRLVAYDMDGNELESYAVGIDTAADSYNDGRFLGFARSSADIYGFGVVGGTMVLDNLTLSVPVPEPGTIAMMLAGLGAMGLVAVRRRRKQP